MQCLCPTALIVQAACLLQCSCAQTIQIAVSAVVCTVPGMLADFMVDFDSCLPDLTAGRFAMNFCHLCKTYSVDDRTQHLDSQGA